MSVKVLKLHDCHITDEQIEELKRYYQDDVEIIELPDELKSIITCPADDEETLLNDAYNLAESIHFNHDVVGVLLPRNEIGLYFLLGKVLTALERIPSSIHPRKDYFFLGDNKSYFK